ncbi:hypothetical protein GJ744_010529 [Endocarpon pusillum]|uniref:Uncharacterized protein n=1 Tax=Endocarpon pusillum TaxID=364733 RepID=A0A8H7E9F4_9EURO|nr:hypothetical protein GJ744_010529 [Endocarpon pusillum]
MIFLNSWQDSELNSSYTSHMKKSTATIQSLDDLIGPCSRILEEIQRINETKTAKHGCADIAKLLGHMSSLLNRRPAESSGRPGFITA